jgi:hypothetical protein
VSLRICRLDPLAGIARLIFDSPEAELDDALDGCFDNFVQALGAGVSVESGVVGEDGVADAALRREVARGDVG